MFPHTAGLEFSDYGLLMSLIGFAEFVTVVVSAIRARARINNIKANSVILRLFFSFSFHLKRREIKLRCRSNMPQPDSQRIILISNELQNIYLELFQIEFQ